MTLQAEARDKGYGINKKLILIYLHLRRAGAKAQEKYVLTRFLHVEIWQLNVTEIVIFKTYGSYNYIESFSVYFQDRQSLEKCLEKITALG